MNEVLVLISRGFKNTYLSISIKMRRSNVFIIFMMIIVIDVLFVHSEDDSSFDYKILFGASSLGIIFEPSPLGGVEVMVYTLYFN